MTAAVWWMIGAFGLGGTALAVGLFIVGWPAIVGTKLGRMLLAIGGAALFVMAAFAKGSIQGAREARQKQEKADADFIQSRDKANRAIDALPDAAVDDRLRDGTVDESGDGGNSGGVPDARAAAIAAASGPKRRPA